MRRLKRRAGKRRLAGVEALERRTVLSVSGIPAVPTAAADWGFNEGAGTTAADTSGNAHAATLGSGASWASGNVGAHALALNGSAAAVATVSGPAVDTSASFTVSAWVNLASLGGYQTVVSIAGANVAGFYLGLRGDTGTFSFARIAADAAGATSVAAAPGAPSTGTWYHIVGVDDVSAGTLTLYVDGQVAGAADYAGGWAAAGNTLIGHGFYNGQQVDYVNGSVDDVSFYAAALSAAQVAALDHPADYSLDDGAGTTAADVSGHGHTLTLGPTSAWTTGHVGSNALAFDGTASSVVSYASPVPDTAQSFSVSAWVNLNSLTGFQTFVSIDGSNISGFYLQYRPDTGKFCFTRASADSASAAGWRADAQSAPAVGTWYHLLGVNDVANSRIQLYVNGLLQSSTSTSSAQWSAAGATVLGAAKFNGSRVDFVNGRIDDVRFYDSPLSAQAAAYLPYVGSDTQSIIDISTANPGITISPDLFGLFMEDINYGGEGGVYNDEVRNSGFNDSNNALNAWAAVAGPGVSATLSSDAATGPTAALTKSGKLTVTSGVSSGVRAGISNSGFFGFAVAPSTRYDVEFYAKASAGFRAPLTVSLESNGGVTYASAVTSTSISGSWTKYTVTLTTDATAPVSSTNRLVISTNASAANGDTIWFGSVHCFPPSYKDSPAHLRTDLMEKLAAMHPAFFRVPGGNYLEGNTYADRFNWSTTIGRLEDRPGHYNSAWGYWSSDGMGLDEYMQMAELIGARPLLAVYAGYTLNGSSDTGVTLTNDVTDAVNELHYVLDPVTTTWGALRAANGHAAPYDVREVEIGNEDFFSSTYATRYPLFYDAIHASFPSLKIIATSTATGGRPYDIIDEHFYPSPATMQSRQDYYDSRSRSGPKVFVGEWASMEGSPTNDMNAALGDATWFMGLQENSDVVTMTSYAPLWANVNGIQWTPDLIGFDNTASYGSPSYYAQLLLANDHGATVVSNTRAGNSGGLRTLVTRTGDTYYLAVVNVTAAANTSAVNLLGVSTVFPDASVITLAAPTSTSTNSITDPAAIVPVTSELSGIDATFSYSFPAYSLTIIKFTANNGPLPSAPTVAMPATAGSSTVTGTTTTLSALGGDAAGEADLTYAWSAAGPAAVTFSDNGTNSAKNSTATFAAAGAYQFAVTITNATGRSVTSVVSVLVQQTPTGLTVSPANSTIETNLTTTLSAAVVDQFGQPITPSPLPVAWTLSAGSGTLRNPGVYTAPAAPGTATITASAPGLAPAGATLTITASLAAWYAGDANSGTTLADSSGQNKTGSLNGSYSFAPGVINNALSLTGGYASLPAGIVSSLDDFTIATWVKVTTIQNWARIFDFGTGTAANMFLTASAGGTLRFAITTSGGGGEQRVNGPALAPDTWTHVAVTLAGTTLTLYVNGVAVGTRLYTSIQPSALGNTTNNYLGKSQYSADPALQGSIDDFRIYARALSPDEISSLVGGVVQGVAFRDTNGDGSRDASEQPLAGATVYLDIDNDGQLDPGEPSAVTSSTGQYAFAGVAPGAYTLRSTAPAGFFAPSPSDISVAPMTVTAADVSQVQIAYAGTAGDDTWDVRRTAAGRYDILVNGTLTYSLPSTIPSLSFALGSGNDTLIIESSDGTITPPAGTSTDAETIVIPYTGATPVSTVRQSLFSKLLSNPNATPFQRLGYVDDGSAIRLKLTAAGDANLDGKLDGDDYALMDLGRLLGRSTWTYGDFNYDGVVNDADAALLDAAAAAGAAAPIAVDADPVIATTTTSAPVGASVTTAPATPAPASPAVQTSPPPHHQAKLAPPKKHKAPSTRKAPPPHKRRPSPPHRGHQSPAGAASVKRGPVA